VYEVPEETLRKRDVAREFQRRKQQGLGRPIISTVNERGQRVVAVGGKGYVSTRWKNFQDFLWEFAIRTLGVEWFQAERANKFCVRRRAHGALDALLWHGHPRVTSLEKKVRQLNWLLAVQASTLILVVVAAALSGFAVLRLDASVNGLLSAQNAQTGQPR
jgi:hypothetical protein